MTSRILTLRRAILLVVVFGLLFPALLISGYSSLTRYDRDVQEQIDQLLQQHIDVLASGIQEPLWNMNRENGIALLDAMISGNDNIVRLEARDASLDLFAASERPERRSGATASAEKQVMYRGNRIGSVSIEVASTQLRKNVLS